MHAISWDDKQRRETDSQGVVGISFRHDGFQVPGQSPHDEVGWVDGCPTRSSKKRWAGDRI